MDEHEQRELTLRLDALRIEHRRQDALINHLTTAGIIDQVAVMRLKKTKLKLRDEIQILQSQLLPDIIA
jgi:hypothetical protein